MKAFSKTPFNVVMVIDDNEVDHFVIGKLFSKVNFCNHPLKFTSAMDALDYLKAYWDVKDKVPELIFVDINMPFMTGFDFLEIFEKIASKADCYKVVVISSTMMEAEIEKAKNHPCTTKFVFKPLDADKLFELADINDLNP
jgi:CheY-like chemotaxis protein